MINIKNFDNIRFVALISVLLVHTCLYNVGMDNFRNELSELSFFQNYNQLLLFGLYVNLFKSGTILFFIISGFLFQIQFIKFDSFFVFIKKKSKSLLRPYLILFVIPTFILIWIVEPHYGIKEGYDLYKLCVKTIESIFLTNYWFVPALFVTLVINFFIKTKYVLKSLILFISIWIVAYVNLYFKFVLTSHTVWFVGFFFVFTLGRLMYLYNERIFNLELLKNKKKLFLITIVFYVISNIEGLLILKYGHNFDYVNTLRVGNILYSFSLFYLLNSLFNDFKVVIPVEVSFYFIYLVHPFVLRISDYVLSKNAILIFDYPSQFIYSILHFSIILTCCVLIQQLFFKLQYESKPIFEHILKK
jgi:hypothetical protein